MQLNEDPADRKTVDLRDQVNVGEMFQVYSTFMLSMKLIVPERKNYNQMFASSSRILLLSSHSAL